MSVHVHHTSTGWGFSESLKTVRGSNEPGQDSLDAMESGTATTDQLLLIVGLYAERGIETVVDP